MASPLHNSQLRNLTTMSMPRQSVRSVLGNGGARVAPSHSVADFRSGESFSHLKLTAEKMIQEQACTKSELQILKTKLQKSDEQVRTLESKAYEIHNENAMLKVKHDEGMKLWKGLDSKFLATTSFCEQLAETLELLKSQVHEAESAKSLLEDKLADRVIFYEETKSRIDILMHKKQIAEDCVEQCETRSAELQLTLQELEKTLASKTIDIEKLAAAKDDLQKQMNEAMKANEEGIVHIRSAKSEIQDLQKELVQKALEMTNLQNANLTLMQAKGELEFQVKDLQNQVATEIKDNESLQRKLGTLNLKISELEKENDLATSKIDFLLVEKEQSNERARRDKVDHVKIVNELKQYIAESEMDAEMIKHQLQEQTQEIESLVKLVADNSSKFALEVKQTREESNKQHQLISQKSAKLVADNSSKFALEVKQMREEINRKDQLISQKSTIESSLRAEIEVVQTKLAGVEFDSKDFKKRCKMQMEAKQIELAKHLQEISQSNNQEMTDMRRKYEVDAREAIAEERLKGERALEAAKQDSNEKMKKEVDALNQRLKVLVKDHDHAVNKNRKVHEQERTKIVALHAEELRKIQLELHTEMEKRSSEVANEFQAKIEESQKSHEEEIGKFRREHQEQLLKMAKNEESSLQLTVKKMQDEHIEGLARRTEEHKSQIDTLEKHQGEQIGILKTSLAKNIEEWKSKALSWEVKFKETLSIMVAKEVSKQDKQTQITQSDVDLLNKMTTEYKITTVENIRTPMAKEPIQQSQRSSGKLSVELTVPVEKDPTEDSGSRVLQDMLQSQRSGKRRLDLASTTEDLVRNANTQTSIVKGRDQPQQHERRTMLTERSKMTGSEKQHSFNEDMQTSMTYKEKVPLEQRERPTQIILNTTSEDSEKQTQSFKQASIQSISAPVSQQMKVVPVRTSYLQKEPRHSNSEDHYTEQRPNVHSDRQGITELGRTDNVIALQAVPPIQKWTRREIQGHGPTLELGKKMVTRGRRKSGSSNAEEPLEDHSKKALPPSKRVKFTRKDLPKSKIQPPKAISPVINDLFQMDDLDPYYKGDDPYAFQ